MRCNGSLLPLGTTAAAGAIVGSGADFFGAFGACESAGAVAGVVGWFSAGGAVFGMSHLNVRLTGFEIGSRNWFVGFTYSRGRGYRLGLAIGRNREVSGLHLVGEFRGHPRATRRRLLPA